MWVVVRVRISVEAYNPATAETATVAMMTMVVTVVVVVPSSSSAPDAQRATPHLHTTPPTTTRNRTPHIPQPRNQTRNSLMTLLFSHRQFLKIRYRKLHRGVGGGGIIICVVIIIPAPIESIELSLGCCYDFKYLGKGEAGEVVKRRGKEGWRINTSREVDHAL